MNSRIDITDAGQSATAQDAACLHPIDDVNSAKAIVLTVWMALGAPDFIDNGGVDAPSIADTLYVAFERLARAEKVLEVQA